MEATGLEAAELVGDGFGFGADVAASFDWSASLVWST